MRTGKGAPDRTADAATRESVETTCAHSGPTCLPRKGKPGKAARPPSAGPRSGGPSSADRLRRPDQHLKRQYGWDPHPPDGTEGARTGRIRILAHNLVKISTLAS